MGVMGRARALLGLVRPDLASAAGICVVAGAVLALGGVPGALQAALGFLAGFLVSGSANVANDIFDLEVDRVNSPGRALPSGTVTLGEAKALSALLAALGLGASACLGAVALAAASAIWAVSMLYNWRLKEAGFAGNLSVSFCVAMTFIFGGIAVGQLNGVVLTFGLLAGLFDLSEEVAGGAMDMEGDSKRSARTLARSRGKGFAMRVSAALLAAVVAVSLLPFAAGWLGWTYLALIVPVDLAVAYFGWRLLGSRTPDEGHARMKQLYLTLTVFVVALLVVMII